MAMATSSSNSWAQRSAAVVKSNKRNTAVQRFRSSNPCIVQVHAAAGASAASEHSSERVPVSSLSENQQVTGTITNTTPYGAFVDIGAERSGLVHISELSNTFVQNVNDHVNTGDQVRFFFGSIHMALVATLRTGTTSQI